MTTFSPAMAGSVKLLRSQPMPCEKKPPLPSPSGGLVRGPSMLQSCGTSRARQLVSSKLGCRAAGSSPRRKRQPVSKGMISRGLGAGSAAAKAAEAKQSSAPKLRACRNDANVERLSITRESSWVKNDNKFLLTVLRAKTIGFRQLSSRTILTLAVFGVKMKSTDRVPLPAQPRRQFARLLDQFEVRAQVAKPELRRAA